MGISHKTIQYPNVINTMPNKNMVSPRKKILLEFNANHTPFDSRDRIFSRIDSMMNSERFLYPRSGFSWIKSSIFFKRGSGILTVVYVVAMSYLKCLFKIIIGSNTVVVYSNRLIGVVH